MTDELAAEETHPISRPCPLCENWTEAVLFTKGTLRLVKCEKCLMIFANPIEHELASGRFYDRMGTSFYLSNDKLRSDFAPVRFEREIRLFRKYCQSGSVLDMGCSTGAFLFQLMQRFPEAYSVTGTDVTSAAVDHAESLGIRVLRTSFLELDSLKPGWDAITFWAVMEHLAEPKRFIAKALELLNPSGLCFILVPNMRSLAVRLLGAKYRYIMPDHVNYFTDITLRKFAKGAAGFRIEKLASTHFNPLVIMQDLRKGAERVSDEDRARLLKKTTGWKQKRFLRPLKLLYTGVERCLASLRLADNLVIVLRKLPR